MTQSYPLPMPSTLKVDDGAARPIPPLVDPGIATLVPTTPVMVPATWAEKATNHPLSSPTATNLSPPRTDPDFVLVTPVNKASNMPY